MKAKHCIRSFFRSYVDVEGEREGGRKRALKFSAFCIWHFSRTKNFPSQGIINLLQFSEISRCHEFIIIFHNLFIFVTVLRLTVRKAL